MRRWAGPVVVTGLPDFSESRAASRSAHLGHRAVVIGVTFRGEPKGWMEAGLQAPTAFSKPPMVSQ